MTPPAPALHVTAGSCLIQGTDGHQPALGYAGVPPPHGAAGGCQAPCIQVPAQVTPGVTSSLGLSWPQPGLRLR